VSTYELNLGTYFPNNFNFRNIGKLMIEHYSEKDRKAAIVALMLDQQFPTAKIRSRLGKIYGKEEFTAGYISKLVSHAERKGWVHIQTIVKATDNIPSELKNINIDITSNPRDILNKYESLNEIRILDFRLNGERGSGFEQVAYALQDILRKTTLLGVSRGATLSNTVHEIRQMVQPLKTKDSAQHVSLKKFFAFPTIAERYQDDRWLFNSSYIARQLVVALANTPNANVPDLTNLFSFLPITLEENSRLRSLIHNYQNVFNPKSGLINEMDSYLTSVSEENLPLGSPETITRIANTTRDMDIDPNLYQGDMGGVLI